jgi:hypothetical protein
MYVRTSLRPYVCISKKIKNCLYHTHTHTHKLTSASHDTMLKYLSTSLIPYVHVLEMHLCSHTHTHTHTLTHTHTHTYTHTHTHTQTHTHTHTHTRKLTSASHDTMLKYLSTSLIPYVHVLQNTRMFTHTHTHTHINTLYI